MLRLYAIDCGLISATSLSLGVVIGRHCLFLLFQLTRPFSVSAIYVAGWTSTGLTSDPQDQMSSCCAVSGVAADAGEHAVTEPGHRLSRQHYRSHTAKHGEVGCLPIAQNASTPENPAATIDTMLVPDP